MNKKIEIYEATLTDDAIGMYTISLVDDPAMEVDWMAFSKDTQSVENETLKLSILEDGMEHKVMVVICRADFPVLRKKDGELIYVVWKKDTIKTMAQRFLKNGYQGYVNIQHQENSYVDGVEMEQIFVKDVEKGIDPKGFENIEDGSLFAVYKIENDEVWEAVKRGVFTAVSLEGLFHIVREGEKPKNTPKMPDFETMDEFMKWLEQNLD